MSQSADSQSVVVTGSSRGIGFGYAREFVDRGHRVTISGRTASDVDAAVEKLGAPDRTAGQTCDVSDIDQVQSLWDLAVERFGRVDLWINNAGFARSGPDLLGHTPEELKLMVQSNTVGTMNGCQVALAGMRTQDSGGRIINTLGGGSKGRVVKGMIGYSTSKRAIHYFSKALAKETKDDDSIRLGTVSPGVNITEGMIREIQALAPDERDKMVKPLNFIGDHVETTTPWLVDQMLAATDKVVDITWLSTGRMLKRGLKMLVGKRDVMSRYGV